MLGAQVVTLTTVGYGDMSPTTQSTRLFTCLYALVRLNLWLGAFLLSSCVEGWMGVAWQNMLGV